MNVATRGFRNAFRNHIRTTSIIVIIGLSIGLALAMLVARQAVSAKITSIKASVGTTISISPAGVRGFEGGGNALTETQLAKVSSLDHVSSISESLSDRLTSTNTNLQSAISAGSLGQRFARNNGTGVSGSGQGQDGGGGFSGDTGGSANGAAPTTFTPPVTVTGSNNPTDLSGSQGGGTFKLTSGQVFASGSNANIALLGSGLANKNNLKVGSTFSAYSTTITVTGIFDGGNTFSNAELIMPLATVQALAGESGSVTSATVTVDTVGNVASVTSAINKQLGSSADVTNQAQTAQTAIAPLQNIQTITLYSLIGAVIAGAVIILLTMIMIVRERRREIGVLKAIGASNTKIVLQFITEAITLTILGAIIGIIIGVAPANPITKLLINNSTSSTATRQTTGAGFGSTGGGTGVSRFGAGTTGSSSLRFGPQANRGRLGGIRNSISNVHAVIGYSIILYGLGTAIIIAVVGSSVASFFIAKVRPAEVMRTE